MYIYIIIEIDWCFPLDLHFCAPPFSDKPLVMLNEEQLQKLKESTCQVLVVYNFEPSKKKNNGWGNPESP